MFHVRVFQQAQVPGQENLAQNDGKIAQRQEEPVKFARGGQGTAQQGEPQTEPGQADPENVAADGIGILVDPAAVEQQADRAGEQQADDEAQGRRAPLIDGDRHLHGQAQHHALVGINHLLAEIGPGLGAEVGHRALQIIIFPERGQLGADVLPGLLQALDQGQGGGQGRIILRQHGGEAQPGLADVLNVAPHFLAQPPVVQILGQAVGHVIDLLQQALGLGAGQQDGLQHLVYLVDRDRDAAAHGLHGIGPVLESIGQHQQAAGLFFEGLGLFREMGRLIGETVAELGGDLLDLIKPVLLAGPNHFPWVVLREQGLFLGLGVLGFLVRRGVGGFILARVLGFGCLVSLVLFFGLGRGLFFGFGGLGGCGLGRGPQGRAHDRIRQAGQCRQSQQTERKYEQKTIMAHSVLYPYGPRFTRLSVSTPRGAA